MWKTPRPTRYASLSLTEVICLCAGPCDNEAWEEFVSRVGKPISLVIMRTASIWGNTSRSLVEDLIQATYLKLWEGSRSLLREFAVHRPDAILAYLKKTAANTTHDYFKHHHSQSYGGSNAHIAITDVEAEAGDEAHGSQQRVLFGIFLNEIDEHLKEALTGPDQQRDRTIFWLYFRQGMSTREIASLPGIHLSTKGVGSVLERLKHAVRDQILGTQPNLHADTEPDQKAISAQIS